MPTHSKSGLWRYLTDGFSPLLLFVLGYMLVSNLLPGKADQEIAAEVDKQNVIVEAETKREASSTQNVENGKKELKNPDCLTTDDRSFPPLITLVRKSLSNPISFEHIKTTTAEDGAGLIAAYMIFRAKSDQAGYFIDTAVGYFRSKNCQLVSWYIR